MYGKQIVVGERADNWQVPKKDKTPDKTIKSLCKIAAVDFLLHTSYE
jgi:hypothetical protein